MLGESQASGVQFCMDDLLSNLTKKLSFSRMSAKALALADLARTELIREIKLLSVRACLADSAALKLQGKT